MPYIVHTHTHKDTQPNASILTIPDWEHTPYVTRSLHTKYIQKIVTLSHTHTTIGTHHRKYNLDIYKVANSRALTLLEPHNIQRTMNTVLTQAYGHTVQTTLIDTPKLDATNIDSITSYKDIPTPIQTYQTTTILYTKSHNRKWNPKDYVYTNGSQVKGNNTLGAGGGRPANTERHTHTNQITKRKTHNQQSRAGIHHVGPQKGK
jgi:hypothetical protein